MCMWDSLRLAPICFAVDGHVLSLYIHVCVCVFVVCGLWYTTSVFREMLQAGCSALKTKPEVNQQTYIMYTEYQ